jgi:GT2 family glycosyltransferase/ADP-heptose:LPS heptosyltransferase
LGALLSDNTGEKMKLSFVIPSINRPDLTNACLASFSRHHGGNHEIIVVDDGSSTEIREEMKVLASEWGVTLIQRETNGGFAKAVNEGIAKATGDVVVLVNNDIEFTERVDKQIVEAFQKDPKIGIVGGLLFYPDGKIQHGGIFFHEAARMFSHRGWHADYDPKVLKPEYILGVTGALFAIRKEMIDQIGNLDESYFVACEDTEYCLRAWSSGWRVFYSPAIKAIHAEGATRGRTEADKISKYRAWYMKEMEGLKKFQEDLKGYDFIGLSNGISSLNMPKIFNTADRWIFQKNPHEHPFRSPTPPETIVVRRTGALGDVILATGVIRKLKQLAKGKVIVETQCGEVFRHDPQVIAVKSAAGIKRDRFVDLDLAYEKRPNVPIWEAYAQEAAVAGESLDPELFSGDADLKTLKHKLGSVDLWIDRVAVIHAAGRTWDNRKWPERNWVAVANELNNQGLKVVTVGRSGDFVLPGLSLVDELTIHEIRELCKRAVVFVGMDSGILHVAQTTEVPIVGLFTVADPAYRVISREAKTLALVPKTECRFCLHNQRPPVTFVSCEYGTNHCLSGISVGDVVESVSTVIASKGDSK